MGFVELRAFDMYVGPRRVASQKRVDGMGRTFANAYDCADGWSSGRRARFQECRMMLLVAGGPLEGRCCSIGISTYSIHLLIRIY